MSGSAGDPVEVDVVLGEGDAAGSRLAPLGEVELQVNGYLVVQKHNGYSKETQEMHLLAKRRYWKTYIPDCSKLLLKTFQCQLSVLLCFPSF